MGTPELRATVAAMSDEKRGDAIVFSECKTEELAGLPDGCGFQAVVNVRKLLNYLPTIEPNMGGNPGWIIPKSTDGVVYLYCLSLRTSQVN